MAFTTAWLNRARAALRDKRLSVILLLCSIAIYGWLVYRAVSSWDVSAINFANLQWQGILVATGIQIVGYLFAVYLWGTLITWLERKASFFTHLQIYAYSSLTVKLPGLFWGIATRLFLYHRIGISKTAVGLAAGLEIVLIGVASSFLSIVLFVFQPVQAQSQTPVPLPVLIVACALLATLTHPRVLRRLLAWLPNPDVLTALERLSWGQLLRMTGAHLLILLMGGLCLFGVLAAVMGFSPELLALALRTWALTVAWSTVLAWLPADFGLRNGPFLLLLSGVFPASTVIILLVVWRVWVNLTELGWGAVGFLVHRRTEMGLFHGRRAEDQSAVAIEQPSQSISPSPSLPELPDVARMK